jgi:hypothetical protein
VQQSRIEESLAGDIEVIAVADGYFFRGHSFQVIDPQRLSGLIFL